MRLITASHITDWANRDRRDCQGMLPLLVRHLVRATAERVDLIDFPAGDAVSDAGWDGRLQCASSCAFVPDAFSGWEIGTERSAPGKAASDYAKRSVDPLDLEPRQTTFVFVTPRAWPDRQNWASQRRAEGTWRDVRVIAASDLEAWLEIAPAVALWLARHIGLAPASGLLGIEQWWARWAGGTEPAMMPIMLVAGRDREVEAVSQWFSSPSAASINVQGDSIDEALGFLRAAADRWSTSAQETLLSRCVVVETEEAFEAAANWSTPGVIAAPADVARAAGLATRNGHRLFLAVGRTLATRDGGLLRLPRADRYALVRAMEETGLPRERAAAIIADCGGSLTVLHRQRSPAGVARHPPWAALDSGRAIIPLLLAGAWSDEIRPIDTGPFGPPPPPLLDHAVLCTLAGGADPDMVTEPAHRYRSTGDAPFRHAASVWQLTAPLDAWYALQEHLRAIDFSRLAEAAIAVLSLPDPKYELPEEEQWLAQTRGKQRSHSGWLRQGLAISLAIVSQHGDARVWPVPRGDASGFTAGVVGLIFSAQQDWRGWASLDDVLPTLAEAAPDTFLTAVERLIDKQPQEAKNLLTDGGGGGSMTGECRHAGLLWALERLAWHPMHLTRAVLCLAHLNAIDPGGRWSNRPFGSLRDILANGDPYTFADPAACLGAFDAIASARPGTAWQLLMDALMPLRGRMVRDPPAHLAACPDGWVPWTQAQRSAYGLGMCDRITVMVEDADIYGLIDALGHVQHLPDQTQVVLCRRLMNMHQVPVTDPADLLWTTVRSAVHRIRSFREDADDESSTEHVLAAVERALAPVDPGTIGLWLFGDRMPQLPDGETLDWQANQERVRLARAEAVRRLLDHFGPADFVTWAAGIHDQGTLGFTLAGITNETEDEGLRQPLLALAKAHEDRPQALLFGYVAARSADQAWFDGWLTAAAANADGAASATLFCTRPFGPVTWRRVDDLPLGAQQLYWRWVGSWLPSDVDGPDAERAAERLLGAGRPAVVLDWLTQRTHLSLSGELLQRLARELVPYLNQSETLDGGSISWRVERLFEHIDRAGLLEDDVAALEIVYLPLLLPLHSKRGPRALHCTLARTPSLFVECICNVWRSSIGVGEHEQAEDSGELREAEKRRARTSHDLLDSWRQPLPGQSGSEIDGEQLFVWIAEVRRLCCEKGRKQIGDVMVGKLLSGSPIDPVDALWPHLSVRRVLDQLPAEELEEGFTSGVINARGVTVRGPHDGGKLERIEQNRYTTWANGMRATSPRTARILDQLAEHYRIDSVREDAAADLNKLR